MPARKKAADQRQDNRPERQRTVVAETASATVVAVMDPSLVPIPPCPIETADDDVLSLWESLFAEPQAAAIIGAQLVVATRWIRAYAAWLTASAAVELDPIVAGSQGQDRPNPLMSWVISREVEMEKCEQQLGIGLRNRADLGVSAAMAKLTAAQVNKMGTEADGSQQRAVAGTQPEAIGTGEDETILEGWAAE